MPLALDSAVRLLGPREYYCLGYGYRKNIRWGGVCGTNYRKTLLFSITTRDQPFLKHDTKLEELCIQWMGEG